MVEIRITYETLFDLLRREKNREELQALDQDFYDQVTAYLKEKEVVIRKKEDSLFASAEREKLKIQFQNIRRIIKELYERREKKILNIALMKARTGSDIIDTSSLLPTEKDFFDEQTVLFSRYKEDVLNRIINLKEHTLFEKETSRSVNPAQEIAMQANLENKKIDEPGQDEDYPSDDGGSFTGTGQDSRIHFTVRDGGGDEPQIKAKNDSFKRVKIKDFLPKFMGKQGEILGPFNKDDVVDLDSQIAELLMKKGRAESA